MIIFPISCLLLHYPKKVSCDINLDPHILRAMKKEIWYTWTVELHQIIQETISISFIERMGGTRDHSRWNKWVLQRQISLPLFLEARRNENKGNQGRQQNLGLQTTLEAMNRINVHYIHLWKCHKETFLTVSICK